MQTDLNTQEGLQLLLDARRFDPRRFRPQGTPARKHKGKHTDHALGAGRLLRGRFYSRPSQGESHEEA